MRMRSHKECLQRFPLIATKLHLLHSPIKRLDVDIRIALIKIFPIQNDPGQPPVTSCLAHLLRLGAFETRFLLYEEVTLASDLFGVQVPL